MKRCIYLLAFIANFGYGAYAQCAMCRATVETHARSMENKVAGLNSAILYLLIIPYLSAGIFWYLWKTNKKKIEDQNRQIRERIIASEK